MGEQGEARWAGLITSGTEELAILTQREMRKDYPATRALIDAQLAARGWDVDTQTIRYSAGSRPVRGRNMAIAE
jgi:type I site-specific restriction endonuclease